MNRLYMLLHFIFHASASGTSSTFPFFCTQVQDVIHENAVLKAKMAATKESTQTAELEHKASRETIRRLAAEVEKGQSVASKYTSEMEILKSVRSRISSVDRKDRIVRR